MSGRAVTYAFIALILGATIEPVLHSPWDDSFPLSTYPMFSGGKPTPSITLRYAVALDASGERRHVPPELVANGEVLQARAVIARAIDRGRDPASELCRHIAGRIAARGGEWSAITEVRLVTGTFDAVEYLTGRDRVGAERMHVSCGVARR
ncbi:MAG TPA: hypothetical protein VML75_24545 [Kofleriaceae bacterium]|nr:hypothetical protein [Kofleriaceae bacterium]